MNLYLRAQIAEAVAALARMDSSPSSRVPSRASHRFSHISRGDAPSRVGAGAVKDTGPAILRWKQALAAEEWERQRLERMTFAPMQAAIDNVYAVVDVALQRKMTHNE